jgi:PAS domain S-box-containing protein
VNSREQLVETLNLMRKCIRDGKPFEPERRWTEEQFRRLFLAVEHSPSTVMITDTNGDIEYVNPKFTTLTGYSTEEVIGKNPRILKSGETPPEDYKRLWEAITSGGEWRGEFCNKKKNGEIYWEVASISPVRDSEGSIKYFVKVAEDITARKRAEDALRESESRIRSIVDNVVDGIITINERGTVESFNLAAERTFGYSANEVIGHNVNILMPEPYHSNHDQYLGNYLRTGKRKIMGIGRVVVGRRKDGSTFPMDLAVSEVRRDKQRLFSGIIRDITERKLAEDSLVKRVHLSALGADVGVALTTSNTLRAMLQGCTEAVVEHLDAAFARIWTLNEKDDVLELQASAGMYTHIDGPHGRVPVGKFKIGRIAQKRKPHLTNNVTEDPHVSDLEWAKREGMVAFAGYPLVVEDRTVGVVAMFAREPLAEYALEALASVANEMALGIERKWAEVELKTLNETLELRVEERTAELQDSEEKYRKLIETASDAIILEDAETGIVLDVNKRAEELIGLPAEQIIGIHQTQLHPEDEAERYKKGFKDVVQKGRKTSTGNVFVCHRDGRKIPVEISSSVVELGGKKVVQGIFRDITQRKLAEEERAQSLEKLRNALDGTVKALESVVDTRDPYTAGHQRRVADMTRAIAAEMGLPEGQVEGLCMAALIHDLGKIAVPAEILSKPGRITETEYSLIKMHSQAGYDILKGIEFPWPIADMVHQHHERMDGSGYPAGLSGDEIILEARILCVADVVEAMSSHRPYRPALGIDAALEEITRNKGVVYDPDVVDACVRLFKEKGFVFKD